MQKDQSVETLRGIAVILMVAGHVIGHDKNAGMQVSDDSIYRYLYFSLAFLRIPLFTAISGYVYGLKPMLKKNLRVFLGGKVRRILFPLLSVGTLQYLLKTIAPAINHPAQISGLWKIYIFPFDQFWFLQAIFMVFLTIAVIEYLGLIIHFKGWVVAFLLSVGMTLFLPVFTHVFSFGGYLYLLPFFLMGLGIQRFPQQLLKPRMVKIYLMLLIAGIILQQLSWMGKIEPGIERTSLISILSGFAGIMLLFRFRVSIGFLAKIGCFSYSIYLFHIFGTAGARIFLEKILGFETPYIIFLLDLAFGITLPILAEKIITSNKYLSTAFLGLRMKNERTSMLPRKIFPVIIFIS